MNPHFQSASRTAPETSRRGRTHGVTYGVNTAFFGSILVANPSHVSTLNQIVRVGARGRRARPRRRACCRGIAITGRENSACRDFWNPK
eukprot:COSAG02_NODE_5012_length_4724_cov_73.188324_3_plen_89_part_00